MARLCFRSGAIARSRPSGTALATRDVAAAPGSLALRPELSGAGLTLGRLGLARLAISAGGTGPGARAAGLAPALSGAASAPTIRAQGEK